MKRILIDKSKCLGCDTCVALCPEVFELGKDGKARIKLEPRSQKSEVSVKEAIEACPVGAISYGQ